MRKASGWSIGFVGRPAGAVMLETEDIARPEKPVLAFPWHPSAIFQQVFLRPHALTQQHQILVVLSGVCHRHRRALSHAALYASLGEERERRRRGRLIERHKTGTGWHASDQVPRTPATRSPGTLATRFTCVADCIHRATSVTHGLLRFRRSTVIRPAASRSRSTRRLIFRLTPCRSSHPFGSGNVALLAFHEA